MAERKKLRESYPYFLANKAIYANQGLEVTDKYTNEVATRVAIADPATVDIAIQKAVAAAPQMAAMASFERKAVLMHVVNSLKSRLEEFAYALCIEAGKPIKDARGEIQRSIDTFQIAAEESTRIYGEYQPLDISQRAKGYQGIVRRFPIGPCSFISPFNFPMNLAAHKVAPALAAGCPFLLKPASRTPVSTLLLGEVLAETNLPEGAFSILPCNRDSADMFTVDDRLKLLSFTGSPDVGWELKAKAGKKKVVLELGGNAAVIVDEGTDLNDATHRIIHGAFYQTGQSCISVQRILAHEALYDELRNKLVQATAELKQGDPTLEETFIGPLITAGDAKRIDDWVTEAVAQGAKVLVGGKRDGVFYSATIVENVPHKTRLYYEEAFGPVCILEKFSDFKAAVHVVNDSKFGLQAGVFTKDINKAFYAFEHLETGGVLINDVPSFRVDSQPYGGVRDSGLGREGIRYAIEDMTELKILMLRNVGQL